MGSCSRTTSCRSVSSRSLDRTLVDWICSMATRPSTSFIRSFRMSVVPAHCHLISFVALSVFITVSIITDPMALERSWHKSVESYSRVRNPTWGRVPPFLLPCSFTSSSFALFYFFPFSFLICFTYFLFLSISSLSTRIVTTPFSGRISYKATEPGFSLFRSFCVVSIALFWCFVVFGLV